MPWTISFTAAEFQKWLWRIRVTFPPYGTLCYTLDSKWKSFDTFTPQLRDLLKSVFTFYVISNR